MTHRRHAIPLLTALCLAGPVLWAWPEALPPWRATGIALGWAGSGLLLASLLLMLREPRLAQALGGLERMYRWHHGTGLAAYVLLLAHPLALAAQGWREGPAQAWATLAPAGDALWLGWAGLAGLMGGLAATFSPHLPYGRWRGLHALLGVAVLLGLAHVHALGIGQAGWLAALVAAGLLAWRWLREDAGLGARPYRVSAAQRQTPDVVEVTLAPLAGSPPLRARPGQFVLAAFPPSPVFPGCGEFHPYTLSATGADGTLRLGIKALGDCTRRLQGIQPGAPARVEGPFGDFLVDRAPGPALWVAGGIGITPFLAALRAGPPEAPVHLLYLYRQPADGAFVAELQDLARAEPRLTLAAQPTGDALPDWATLLPPTAEDARRHCYLCGPPGLVAALRAELARRGVPAEHIHFESFDFR